MAGAYVAVGCVVVGSGCCGYGRVCACVRVCRCGEKACVWLWGLCLVETH